MLIVRELTFCDIRGAEGGTGSRRAQVLGEHSFPASAFALRRDCPGFYPVCTPQAFSYTVCLFKIEKGKSLIYSYL